MSTVAPSPFEVAADILDPPKHRWADDVPGWAAADLDEHMTEDQRRICEALRDNRYVAVRSAHDLGKSYTAARIAAHWIETHPPGEAFVVTTAPTWSQVKAILWRELARAHRKGGLRGRITEAAEWKLGMGIGPDELVAIGRKPADYDPSAFQGIHALYVLVIVDEAGGVPKTIFDAVDTLVTNENSKVLAVGNPDDPASHFATICKPGSGWKVLELDALRSPNFTKEAVAKYPRVRKLMIREGIKPTTERIPDSLRPLLISPRWVDERIARWGIDSPLFTSKVRGRFPAVTLDTIIQPGWVIKAQNRENDPINTDSRLGVDVARYGTDESIVVLRRGGHCRVVVEIPKGPITELVGRVQNLWQELDLRVQPVANVDDTGVGGGVTDMLIEDGYPTLPLVAGARCSEDEVLPNGKPRFVDARSEWWWRARQILAGPSGTGDDSVIDIDPDDEDLAAQLTAVKYRINRHGQIQVESKDEMRARGLASPDRADAFVMSLVATPIDDPRPQVERMFTYDLLRAEW